jgi:hypothetical protein
MKTFAVALMAVLFTATTVEAGFSMRPPTSQKHLSAKPARIWETPEQNELEFALEEARGFYHGFQKGLYK